MSLLLISVDTNSLYRYHVVSSDVDRRLHRSGDRDVAGAGDWAV